MAKYQPLPKTLQECDKQTIKDLVWVVANSFPADLSLGEANKPLNEPAVTFDGLFHWSTNKDLLIYVLDLTDTSNIRDADRILEQSLTKAPEYSEWTTTPAPESPAPANMPTDLKEKIKVEEKESAELKQTQVRASAEVQAAIDRQKEIFAEELKKAKDVEAALKDKKIYYKVNNTPIPETKEIKDLKAEAVKYPKKFIEDAAKQFAENPNLKELTVDEALVASKQAAITTYDTLVGDSPIISVAVINSFIANPENLKKIAPDIETQTKFRNIVQGFIDKANARAKLTSQLTNVAKANGFENPEDVALEFSETSKEGFREFDFNQQIVLPHIEDLNQQSALLNVGTLGEREIRSQFLSFAGKRLENYVATLPENSLLAQSYNSEIVQLGLSSLGIVEAIPWVAAEGSVLGKIIVGSGYGPVAGFIQAKTGINLGIKKVAVEAGKKAIEKVGGQAAGQVATKVATGFLPKIFAAIGSLGSWATFGLTTAIGWVVGKIIEHIPWKKIKEWSAAIVGGIAGLIALPFLGIGAALGIGLGTTAVTAAVGGGLGGVTLAGAASGVAGFFGAIGGAFIGSVATPILITLLGFPVAVALILFIINSGAYVVPPGGNTTTSPGSSSECAGSQKPAAANVTYSSNGKYAYPLDNAGSTSPSCTHWDHSLATDIFVSDTHVPVLAYASGTIDWTSENDSLGGKYIILAGSDGRFYYYAHNCVLYVKPGDTVKVGDVMALSDNTGNAATTAEHLHFAISSSDIFPDGAGTVCPSKDFEDNFNLGKCNVSNECIP